MSEYHYGVIIGWITAPLIYIALKGLYYDLKRLKQRMKEIKENERRKRN